MRVHGKVSPQRRANRVSGHRFEAGQMRGKGQKGHSILITGRSEGFVNLVFQLSHLVERKLTSLLSSAHFFFTGFVFFIQ